MGIFKIPCPAEHPLKLLAVVLGLNQIVRRAFIGVPHLRSRGLLDFTYPFKQRTLSWARELMNAVGIEIRRFVDESQPGFVECWLTDINGREWSFVEKVPVVTTEDLDAESDYPRPGIIACEVIGREFGPDDREAVVIDTELPWGVGATTGETRFVVSPAQLQQWD